MKRLIAAWTIAFTIVAISVGSCAINHRSGEFECTKQSDCDGGRQCVDGFCILPGGTGNDGGGGSDGDVIPDAFHPPDASSLCPSACTSCNLEKNECKIDCGLTNCSNAITCPTGMNCDIICSTGNSCRNGVNCAAGHDCNITCSGNSSCRNVSCGTGACTVDCVGTNSCRGISCGQSCACDVKCADPALCDTVVCSALQCTTIGGGCSSQNPGCDTCP